MELKNAAYFIALLIHRSKYSSSEFACLRFKISFTALQIYNFQLTTYVFLDFDYTTTFLHHDALTLF
jgi:hypothetical protein